MIAPRRRPAPPLPSRPKLSIVAGEIRPVPDAYAEVVMDKAGRLSLLVEWCPWCEWSHQHSIGGGYGLRVSHCKLDAKQYRLVPHTPLGEPRGWIR
jgi:hypothetical protein